MTKKGSRWPSGRQGMAVLESLKGVGRARTEPFKVTGERLSLLAGSTLGQAKVSILVNGNPVVSPLYTKASRRPLGSLRVEYESIFRAKGRARNRSDGGWRAHRDRRSLDLLVWLQGPLRLNCGERKACVANELYPHTVYSP